MLIRTAELLVSGQTRESIRRLVRRGDLVRIRRGAYCLGEAWRTLNSRERHIVRAAAVVSDVQDPVLAGRSAAAVWGIPVLDDTWPAEVLLLATYRGGGKSEPGVRRTSVGARNAPITVHQGLPVTSLARTVVDLAATEGFVAGVVAADWALRTGSSRGELLEAVLRRSSAYGQVVARQSVAFADGTAENGGESVARAVIYQLGFEEPELQVVVRDRIGEMRVDFRWRRSDGAWVFGEFDGKQKYTRQEYNSGDPAEVVWREKKREDRLRAIPGSCVRILWSHLANPVELIALLSDAGVPRRGSARLDPVRIGSNRAQIQPSGRGGVGRLDG
ncbi:type IV toxin-antitoxin system AbiEi family antitoxin domain-containing protein [Pseudolysinimonas sp.]|uniref:type IV toxin-antitoxin system AbiEi family antitoxin domain-containing protein n=1 Tax=Pseudolysinimonas sp. TaxID=2680009 RepID=UPI00286CB102|nr:type IV toxin-antitoxin system AbiEi family antitoxin domain-containing protein [Pseudolysinimonas sp.]